MNIYAEKIDRYNIYIYIISIYIIDNIRVYIYIIIYRGIYNRYIISIYI